MAILATCPTCSASLRLANESLAGKTIRCPKCANAVKLPAATSAAAPTPMAPAPPAPAAAPIAAGLAKAPAPPPMTGVKRGKSAAPAIEPDEAINEHPQSPGEKASEKKAPARSRGLRPLDFVGFGVAALYLAVLLVFLFGVFDADMPNLLVIDKSYKGSPNPNPPKGGFPPDGGKPKFPPDDNTGPLAKIPPKDQAAEAALAKARAEKMAAAAKNEKEIVQLLEKRAADSPQFSMNPGHIKNGSDSVYALRFAPGGELIAVLGGNTLTVHDLRSGKVNWQLTDQPASFNDLAFGPDGQTLATVAQEKSVRLWDVATGSLKKQFPLPATGMRVFFPAGSSKKLVVVIRDEKSFGKDQILSLNLQTGATESQISANLPNFQALAVSPGGEYVAWGDYGSLVNFWDLASGQKIHSINLGKQNASVLAFSPDGWTLAVGGGGYQQPPLLKLIDLDGWKERSVGTGHASDIQSLGFSPDGKLLAVGYAYKEQNQKRCKFWDTETGKEKATLPEDWTGDRVAFSPGGVIFAGSNSWGSGAAITQVADLSDPQKVARHEALKELTTFANLSRKNGILRAEITNAAPAKLAILKKIDVPLVIASYGHGLNPAQCAALKEAPCIVGLELRGSDKINDKTLADLTGLENLTILDLEGCPNITQAGMEHLKVFKKLSVLNLHDTGVKGSGLQHLKGLVELTDLNLGSCPCTDADLAVLAGLTKLQRLRLDFTQISDAGLAHVAKLSALKMLGLQSNHMVGDAGMAHLKGLTDLEDLDLWGTGVGDNGAAQLAGLLKLKHLNIQGTLITDQGFVHLAKLTNLTDLGINELPGLQGPGLQQIKYLPKVVFLSLVGTQLNDAALANLKDAKQLRSVLLPPNVSDAGIAHLAGLENLEELDLQYRVKVTGDGLKHLKNTKLRKLYLQGSGVTDAGLASLAEVTSLQELTLPKDIGDAGMAPISKLTKLQKLNLSHTKITDAGLAQLKSLTSLEELYLEGTDITDASVATLMALPNLKRVLIYSTQITQQAKDDLFKAKPKLKTY